MGLRKWASVHSVRGVWVVAALGYWLTTGSIASATLLLRYTFDEASSGTTAAINVANPGFSNSSGVNNGFIGNATRTNSTPGNASVGALHSPGALGDYLGSTQNPDVIDGFTATSGFTLMTWINLRAAPASGNGIISNSGSTNGLIWDIRTPNTGTLGANDFAIRLYSRNASTDAAAAASSVDLDASNKWIFIAVSYDGANSQAVKYYSGDEANAVTQLGVNRTLANTPNFNSGGVNLRVGSTGRTSDTEANAYYDDVRIYDQVLDVASLEAIRQQAVPEPGSVVGLAMAGLWLLCRARRSGI